MRVVALDLSLTSTGWATNRPVSMEHPHGWERGTIGTKKRGMERLQVLLDEVLDVATGADVAVLESYSYSSRQSHAHSLGELGGVIRLALHQRGVPMIDVPPATLKILACGKGNAPKEQVLVEAVKRLGYQGADNNESDSLWLLQFALIHYELPGAVELPKKHLRALEKIEWPDVGALVG